MSFIKKFDDYLNKLDEALNSNININWIETNTTLIGEFEVNDSKYEIECKKQISNNWTFSFFYLDDNGDYISSMKNDGINMYKVLSAIKTGFYYLYDAKSPNSIIFSAIDDSNTRKRLYTSFCETFCKEKKMKFLNKGNSKYIIYVLFNDSLNQNEKDNILYSLQKIIELYK